MLAAAGGAAGLAVTWWGVELLRYLTSDLLPRAVAPRMDVRVLVFAILVTAVTGLLFGTWPAFGIRRAKLNDALRDGGRGATAGGHRRMQSALIIAEVGLTAVLLSSAGLLLRSLANTATVDPGFEPARVLAFDVSLPNLTYGTNEKRLAFTATLLERLRGLPGVEAAGAGRAIPFTDGGSGEYLPPRRSTRGSSRPRLCPRPARLRVAGLPRGAGRSIACRPRHRRR